MSMHFYSTSQKVLFDMEVDLFQYYIYYVYMCRLGICLHIFVKERLQRFLNAWPRAFEFQCGFRYLSLSGCFESSPNSSSLPKSESVIKNCERRDRGVCPVETVCP